MRPPATRTTFRTAPALLALLLAGLPTLSAVPAAAQDDVIRATAACSAGDQSLEPWCREVSLALRSAHGGVGALAAGGNDLPGSASTVGWRLASLPRVSVAGRLQTGRLAVPAAFGPDGLAAWIETDEFDAEKVVVGRILETGPAGDE